MCINYLTVLQWLDKWEYIENGSLWLEIMIRHLPILLLKILKKMDERGNARHYGLVYYWDPPTIVFHHETATDNAYSTPSRHLQRSPPPSEPEMKMGDFMRDSCPYSSSDSNRRRESTSSNSNWSETKLNSHGNIQRIWVRIHHHELYIGNDEKKEHNTPSVARV